jgi:hypothetical protein
MTDQTAATTPEPTIADAYHELTGRWSVRELVEHAMKDGEYCCQVGCGSGACESCPCCCAGYCVGGADGVPDDAAHFRPWLAAAAVHNAVAARLLASQPPCVRFVHTDQDTDWICECGHAVDDHAGATMTTGPCRVCTGEHALVVHHHDMEATARHFNQGYAEAVEQFESLLSEAAEDLAVEAPAGELMGYLRDAVKAMAGGGQ